MADISAASQSAFDAALALQAETTGSTQATPKSERLGLRTGRAGQRFTIVIDPGHGGIDGGAAGPNGTVEKAITLTFAVELRDKLRADGRYDVFMTREKDEFLRLDDRVRIARQHEADLFISIHADTIRLKGIRGATVYTVSDKASDAEAQALADRENLSDQLAGIAVEEENQEVADILIDLIRRETHSFSMRFARSLVGELSTRVGLDQQSAPLRRLQGAEGAGRAVGAGRTRLSVERQGRGAAEERRMARQGGDQHLQGDRAIRDLHRRRGRLTWPPPWRSRAS